MYRSESQHEAGSESHTIDAVIDVGFVFRLRFATGVFDQTNHLLADVMPGDGAAARSVVVIDQGVADAWPQLRTDINLWFAAHADRAELKAKPIIVTGGEAAKNDNEVCDQTMKLIHDAQLCRHSYVIAIGGGAMLDAVGFAAATAHRGVRIIRFPTTVLAQDDAGIGVKNGINRFGKKNFAGTFAVPWAVINDPTFLQTLPLRHWRSGFSEAVKVALLKDASFFERISDVASRIAVRDMDAAQPIIQQCALLHLAHICDGGDPFEMTTARPLDFGHWSAHKLEQMTDFTVTHGEAVAIGLALDVCYAARLGMLDWSAANRIIACLHELGFDLYHEMLRDTVTLFEGLEEFREHLGGELTITLIEDIGRSVDVHDVNADEMKRAIDMLADIDAEPTARKAV